jgi:ubiquitin carboxyl-terminal hydrolase 47
MTSIHQVAIFLRRWRPSKYEVGPLEEIVLDSNNVSELTQKVYFILYSIYKDMYIYFTQ